MIEKLHEEMVQQHSTENGDLHEEGGGERAALDMDASTDGDSSSSSTTTSSSNVENRSSTFRKFRHLLMAKRFETQDNLPIAVLPSKRLFIGSFGAANNLDALRGYGISHLLCVSPTLPLQFPDSFTYLRLEIADLNTVRISECFPVAIDFIDSAIASGGTVLVHCFMGKSRSAAIIAAYLIARHRMTVQESLAFLTAVRPQVQPNTGFLRQLAQFEREQQHKEQ